MFQRLLLVFLFVGASIAAQSTVDVPVAKDAYIYFNDLGCGPPNCYRANQNYGNSSVIHIASYHIDTRGVIGFTLGGLSAWNGDSSSIQSVVLYLPPLTLNSIAYVSSACSFTLNPIEGNWGEYTITANNLPQVNYDVSYTVSDTADAAPGTVKVDITDYVKCAVGGAQRSFGFVIRSTGNCAIPSREANPGGTFVRVTLNTADTSSCPSNLKACGNVCYDANIHECADPTRGGILCPINNSFCGGGCYNRGTHVCIADHICPVGNGLCNGGCYDQTDFECFSGFLCRRPYSRCGGECYDTSIYSCSKTGTLQQKSA